MKNPDLEQWVLWPSAEQVEKAREELRKRIMDEQLESARREALNGFIIYLKVDAKSFRKFWIRPLMDAGATLDVALACIAQSCFRPN